MTTDSPSYAGQESDAPGRERLLDLCLLTKRGTEVQLGALDDGELRNVLRSFCVALSQVGPEALAERRVFEQCFAPQLVDLGAGIAASSAETKDTRKRCRPHDVGADDNDRSALKRARLDAGEPQSEACSVPPPTRPAGLPSTRLGEAFRLKFDGICNKLTADQRYFTQQVNKAGTESDETKKKCIQALRKHYVLYYEKYAQKAFDVCFGRQEDLREALKMGNLPEYTEADVRQLGQQFVDRIKLDCDPDTDFLTDFKVSKIKLAVLRIKVQYLIHLWMSKRGYACSEGRCTRLVNECKFGKCVNDKLARFIVSYNRGPRVDGAQGEPALPPQQATASGDPTALRVPD